MKIFHILLISSSAFYCKMCKKIIIIKIKKKIVHVAGQSLGRRLQKSCVNGRQEAGS